MVASSRDPAPAAHGRKAVLICQHCGHQSHVRGDWTQRGDGDDVALECPDCEHTVLDWSRT